MKHDGILCISCLCQFLPTNTRNFFVFGSLTIALIAFNQRWCESPTKPSTAIQTCFLPLDWMKSHFESSPIPSTSNATDTTSGSDSWHCTQKKDWDIWCHGNCMFPFFFQVKNIDVQDYFVTVRIFCFSLKPYTIDSANSELSELKPSCSHRP